MQELLWLFSAAVLYSPQCACVHTSIQDLRATTHERTVKLWKEVVGWARAARTQPQPSSGSSHDLSSASIKQPLHKLMSTCWVGLMLIHSRLRNEVKLTCESLASKLAVLWAPSGIMLLCSPNAPTPGHTWDGTWPGTSELLHGFRLSVWWSLAWLELPFAALHCCRQPGDVIHNERIYWTWRALISSLKKEASCKVWCK